MNMKALIGILILTMVSVALIGVIEAYDEDTATISITVSGVTYVDISPNSWVISSIEPRQSATNYTFMIENTGSNNITTIYAYTTYPDSNPFASGNATAYNAGNFLLVQRNDTSSGFFFCNRVEYNDSETWDLRYLTLPPEVVSVGRFRIGANEYFWALVGNGTPASELCTNGTIYISTTAHTDTSLGDVVLTDNSIQWQDGDETKDGVLIDNSLTEPSELADYAIYVDDGCEFVALFKWADPTNAGPWNADDKSSTDQQPLYDSTAENKALMPGENFPIDLRVTIPSGVMAGTVTQGTLTIRAYP